MEEADKLCDRIAIVDHGNLVALGTPMELKNSVAGANVVEVHFDRETPEWQERLEKLDGVTSVQPESAGFYRVLTASGSKTTMQLVRDGGRAGRDAHLAQRAEHHAGRRVCSLHRPATAR